MVSGHFDPFHDGHLDYIKQASKLGNYLICVVSSDEQLRMKKGSVNIPEQGRTKILESVLRGLDVPYEVVLNKYDEGTSLIAETLKIFKPDILVRGGDKTIDDMPADEQRVCTQYGIRIVHAKHEIDRHGSEMKLDDSID